jgi:hypothetical protein
MKEAGTLRVNSARFEFPIHFSQKNYSTRRQSSLRGNTLACIVGHH